MLPTPYVKCDYEKVYEPAEDSFLLLDSLEKDLQFLQTRFDGNLAIVCELGPGSGIVTTFMMQNNIPSHNGALYLALDINPWALEGTLQTATLNNCIKENGHSGYLEPVQSDLTTGLRDKQVDLLVFNPPYVPAEEVPEIPDTKENIDQWLDLALLGGVDGMEITGKVLDSLETVLSPKGVAYILFCARNKPEQLVQKIMQEDPSWDIELIEHRKAGWEVLSVYRFMHK
ncbi:S-adenosylmethionine-dependent methyltransferase KNAG_0I00940 [Huiozyma naganishii CBS 8797]|uniref:Uncharacterized protein n=1 Tax=Huiozyma naganishii (strain ATCC MYA-139 / BCRC 22969 / CBS 8797 / KCTC 17520 / NBRC 10181 / NCYC 3082 / Yp74L-3) TaxID=1071383 RepID=J7RAI5_HUIN7|nr:hypothetical protein KNAG_0I00940 [Kazachstania naganishii CBS 8797]CCK71885.1 hypothetical protein KNAG_0I00940 [Kazachstania naganishii CBS 8797]